MEKIYLDNNSTTALDPRVLQAMMADLNGPPANPSSIHSFGARAKKMLHEARQSVALFFGVLPEEIIFTSGGTESLNLMLRSLPKGHLVTTHIEHAAVYRTVQSLETQGFPVTYLSPGLWGAPTIDHIAEAIRPDTRAIILCSANNETGVMIDLPLIAKLSEERGIPLLLDAVSHIGKQPFMLPVGVSALACSGHKFHAPKGVGVLILRKVMRFHSTLTGGNQEYKRRAGTENLAGILGLAEGLNILKAEQVQITEWLFDLRSHFEYELFRSLPDLSINGQGPRLSNTANIAFFGCDGESLAIQLDMAGIAVSLGSACSSGALETSRVLIHMGIEPKIARSSIRFSFGRLNTRAECDEALERIVPIVQKMRNLCLK